MADARETIVKVDAVSVSAAVMGAQGALVGISGGCSGGSCGSCLSFSWSFSLCLCLRRGRRSGLRISLAHRSSSSCSRFGDCCSWLLGSSSRRLHESPDQVETVEVSSGIRLELDDEVVGVNNLALEPSGLHGVVEPRIVNVAELFKKVAVVGAVWNVSLDSKSVELVDVHAHLSCGFTADDESKMVPFAVLVLTWSTRSVSWVSRVATCGAVGGSLLFNVHFQDLDEHSC